MNSTGALTRTPFLPKTDGVCSVCGGGFIKFSTTAVVCSLPCAKRVPVIARNTIKRERKETKAALDALQPLSHWAKKAERNFNKWVCLRDVELPCVSCGRANSPHYHAGHYMGVGRRPELRFDPANVHKQCAHCNKWNHGAPREYRVELIKRIGLAEVERLEGPNPPNHYDPDTLRALASKYRALAKELTK